MNSTRNSKKILEALVLIVILALVCVSANAATRYVPSQYSTIQAAINACSTGDIVIVADGIYTGDGNRDIDFLGKAITVRSQNGPDNCVIDCQGTEAEPHRGFDFHSGETSASILEGFTITNGYVLPIYEQGFHWERGGGAIRCWQSSPKIKNCVFTKNHAPQGVGIYCYEGSSPTISNCTIIENSSEYIGGGITCRTNCSPTIRDSIIRNNSPWGIGCHYGSSPIVIGCTIQEHHDIPGCDGGGIDCQHNCNPYIKNCVITNNSAGIFCYSSNPELENCTISYNTSGSWGAGGIGNPGGGNESPTVINCILWNNLPGEIVGLTPTVTFSNIKGGWPGVGNIDTDPLFVDSANNDYHLLPSSPCIDAGNDAAVSSSTDLDGSPRIQGVCVDMGAFESPHSTTETMLARLALFIMEEVDAGNIDTELERSLLAKVNAALAALDRGNPNDAKVAMNDLKALINQVEAQVDKKITPEAAAEVIQQANAIMAALSN